jgi:hypothetical protein
MSGRDHLRAVQESGTEAAPRKRKSQLPSEPPETGAPSADLASWATVALGLGSDPILNATRYGRHLEARMVLILRSEQRITFERQGDVFEARKLIQTVIAATGAEIPYYGPADVQKIATALVRLSDLAAEDDDRSEAIDWAHSFLSRSSQNVIDVQGLDTPEGRWEALNAIERFVAPADLPAWAPAAEKAVVVRDSTGRRLVRVADVAAHVRGEIGRAIAWPALHSRMVEIGWDHRGQIQQRQPGGHGKLKARVYAIPTGWDEA